MVKIGAFIDGENKKNGKMIRKIAENTSSFFFPIFVFSYISAFYVFGGGERESVMAKIARFWNIKKSGHSHARIYAVRAPVYACIYRVM
jgi:hypothetical protein